MNSQAEAQRRGKLVVRYALWCANVISLLAIRWLSGPKHLALGSETAESFGATAIWVLVGVEFVVSLVIRFAWLPHVLNHSGKTLVAMILGCSLAEGAGFQSIFLMRPIMDVGVGVSLLLLLSYCPAFTPAEYRE